MSVTNNIIINKNDLYFDKHYIHQVHSNRKAATASQYCCMTHIFHANGKSMAARIDSSSNSSYHKELPMLFIYLVMYLITLLLFLWAEVEKKKSHDIWSCKFGNQFSEKALLCPTLYFITPLPMGIDFN